MSIVAIIIISVLCLIVLLLLLVARALINFAGGLLGGLIQGMGGPDITKRRKKRSWE